MKLASTIGQTKEQRTDIKERAYEFLKERRSGVLATIDPETGHPHATVIYYSVATDCSILFLTKKETRKARNISAGGAVMFLVYDEFQQAVVQISGAVRRVDDKTETHKQFLRTLRQSLRSAESAVPPVSKLSAGDYVEYVIVPDDISFLEYKYRS